jgi:hypothetical protein
MPPVGRPAARLDRPRQPGRRHQRPGPDHQRAQPAGRGVARAAGGRPSSTRTQCALATPKARRTRCAWSCDNAAAVRGQGRWTQRARVGVPVRGRPAARRALPRHPGGFRIQIAHWRRSDGRQKLSIQYRRPVRSAARAAPRLAAIEEEQVFALRLNGEATARQPAPPACGAPSTAWANACRCACSTASRAPSCSRHLGWDKAAQQALRRYATVQCNRRLSRRHPRAARLRRRRGHAQRRANRVERRFAFTGARALHRQYRLRARERPGRLHADPPDRAEAFSAPVAAPRPPRTACALGQGRTPAGDRRRSRRRRAGGAAALCRPAARAHQPSPCLPAELKDASGRAAGQRRQLSAAQSPPARCRRWPSSPPRRSASSSALPKAPTARRCCRVTLRRTEPAAEGAGAAHQPLQPQGDADIIAWFTRVQRYDEHYVPRALAKP